MRHLKHKKKVYLKSMLLDYPAFLEALYGKEEQENDGEEDYDCESLINKMQHILIQNRINLAE